MVAPSRRPLFKQLLAEPFVARNTALYFRTLWIGAPLPTDQPEQAREAIVAVAEALQSSGEAVELPALPTLNAPDLQRTLLDLNDRYDAVLEQQYAIRQRLEWQDIIGYLVKLQNLRKRGEPHIPSDQAPEYFEWAIWRAFLAIDSLTIPPWEARKFKFSPIEEKPVSGAPSGSPDLVFEFANYALVVEVTLTAGSRQEAAEGEPVRRHVAKVADAYLNTGKPVLGLFIANRIDTNTADTFQRRKWYDRDDREISVDIVPLTLAQFTSLFEAGFSRSDGLTPDTVLSMLASCIDGISGSPTQWKEYINVRVEETIRAITAVTVR